MRAAHILNEHTPNKREAKGLLTTSGIQMGFEVETLLSYPARPTVNPNEPTWENLQPILDISPETSKEINRLYQTDRNDKGYSEGEYSIDLWIQECWGSNAFLLEDFEVEPLFGNDSRGFFYTELPTEDTPALTPQERSAEEISDLVGATCNDLSHYHVTRKLPYEWYIEPDNPIKGEGTAAEIVSAVYDLPKAIDMLSRVFGWMHDNDHTTNGSTGLHINLSIKGKEAEDFDYIKMMIFFDENYTAEMFDRLGDFYCDQMRSKLASHFDNRKGPLNKINPQDHLRSRSISDITEMLKRLGQVLKPHFFKYFSINNRGRVFEFRSMGGTDYHLREEEIRRRIMAMANVMRIGADPDLFAREYIRKVYLLLDSGKFHQSEPGTGQFSVPNELSSLNGFIGRDASLAANITKDPIMFLSVLGQWLDMEDIKLSPPQQRQLRAYCRKINIDPHSLDVHLDSEEFNRLAQVVGWPLRQQ